ncbi:uncharacterized protein METZ01_LOCUS374562, partial [marine metagenome]
GIAEGECDCEGNVLDCAGVCGGGAEVDDFNLCGNNNLLQGAINAADCGAELNIPEGDYDESIVIHKCITLIGESDDRGRRRILQGTDIDFNERDNDDCDCDDVTLIGIEFYSESDESGGALSVSSEVGSLTITDGLFDGNAGGYAFTGSDIGSLEVSGSSFINSTGVSITGGSVVNHQINESSFTNNSHNMDVSEDCDGTLDATYNWWGSSEGPGDSVTGDVNYAPWYISEGMTEAVTLDECGVWGGSGIPEGDCDCDGNVLDCAGACGGSTVIDQCGVCGGSGIAEGECDCEGNVLDCAG